MSSLLVLCALLVFTPSIAATAVCPSGQDIVGPCLNDDLCPVGTCVNKEVCCAEPTVIPGKTLCRDFSPDCAAKVDLCTDSVYKNFMARQCPKTCNACDSANRGPQQPRVTVRPSPNCQDANLNCPSWIENGFCSNAFYSREMKLRLCGSSCGLC